MSATGRGSKREARDYYPTPPWCVVALREDLHAVDPRDHLSALDAGAGDGRIGAMLETRGFWAEGVDLEPQGKGVTRGDFLGPGWRRARYDVVASNPPFGLAYEFLRAGLAIAPNVVMLVRLNWLGSDIRSRFFRLHPPRRVLVLTPRPSFVKGKTDACEYAWIYWCQGKTPTWMRRDPWAWARREELESFINDGE